MKEADNLKMIFGRGAKVEVKNDEEGFKGAWYEAIILRPPTSRSKSKAKVYYSTLLANDGVHTLCEDVCVTNLRPFPPDNENERPFEVYEVVDAYYNDGWWKGVVMSTREVNEEKKYKVLFENPPEELEFCASKLRIHFDWIANKWVKPPKQIDASLTSYCQGQSDGLVHNKERKTNVAVQLGGANVLNNSCENQLNYHDILNSKFKGVKRRACKSNAESSSPCKKFRGERSAVKCHEKSAPLEQLIGEKLSSCMHPVTGSLPSVESMSPINSGTHEDEATVEGDMMTFVGMEEITAENMATGSHENSCGSMILDQPQSLCLEGETDNGKGETDNRKGALEEMFTPQVSTDFTEGVNVVYEETNRLVKSGGRLMDDQCQLLCLQETSAPLVATQCPETVVTDDSTTECMLKSCAASNIDRKSQLCSEGKESKLMSTETSTLLSAADFMTEKPDMVDTTEAPDTVGMTSDHIAKPHVTSAIQQPKLSSLEAHLPQNQFDDQRDGETMTATQSPVTNVEVNNALDVNEVIPFIKNPRLWKIVDSYEIFKLMPQKPHFRPLMNIGEAFREGFAIGYMATFCNVEEKISELQVTDSQNKFIYFLETLAELEKHGFRVTPLVDRVNMLLSMKNQHRQLEDQSKDVEAELTVRSSEKAKLEASILVIDNVVRELGKDRELFILLAKMNNRDISALEQDDSVISEGISTVMRDFETLAAAPW